MSESDYLAVPVSAARDIALSFEKQIVVITCYDHKHKQLHSTTYGIFTRDKIIAAEWGDKFACVAGFNTRAQAFEDFRKPALRAERVDELLTAAKEILAHLNQRIEEAPENATPVFTGIARLHAAVQKFEDGK